VSSATALVAGDATTKQRTSPPTEAARRSSAVCERNLCQALEPERWSSPPMSPAASRAASLGPSLRVVMARGPAWSATRRDEGGQDSDSVTLTGGPAGRGGPGGRSALTRPAPASSPRPSGLVAAQAGRVHGTCRVPLPVRRREADVDASATGARRVGPDPHGLTALSGAGTATMCGPRHTPPIVWTAHRRLQGTASAYRPDVGNPVPPACVKRRGPGRSRRRPGRRDASFAPCHVVDSGSSVGGVCGPAAAGSLRPGARCGRR
jgi:hypothetical protein